MMMRGDGRQEILMHVEEQQVVQNPLVQLIASIGGTIGFAIVFNCRGRVLIIAGIGTALTLGAYLVSYDLANGNYFTATLLAACFAAVFANVSAFAFKTSPTAFLTMCIYPMLPGSELYRLVYSIIMDDRVGYHEHGRKIFLICMAIALGCIIVEVLYKYTRFITHRNKE